MSFINISNYKFVSIPEAELPELRAMLKEKVFALGLKGTILLSTEGINQFLSGTREAIDSYKKIMDSHPYFGVMSYKESPSEAQPFTRMLVRLKKEIISMGCPEIRPEQETAPHLAPEDFKRWYEEGKDMLVLDTRNDYEIRLGTFESAIDLDIKSFRDFPNAIQQLPEEFKNKPIVTFCTGGVRCEKAAQLMLNQGFKEVYQLDGGILNYFEHCGGDHYEGECFVFDKRVAVDSGLQETKTIQCYACRNPLSLAEQEAAGGKCSYCGADKFLKGPVASTHHSVSPDRE